MKPLDVQAIGKELAIRWDDESESYIPLESLRRACPCAGCKGELDVMGQLHKGPDRPLSEHSFQLIRLEQVGGYAIRPIWGDGHASGLFSFELLRELAEGC